MEDELLRGQMSDPSDTTMRTIGYGLAVATVTVLLVDALTADLRDSDQVTAIRDYGALVGLPALLMLVIRRWWPWTVPIGLGVAAYLCLRIASHGFWPYWLFALGFGLAALMVAGLLDHLTVGTPTSRDHRGEDAHGR